MLGNLKKFAKNSFKKFNKLHPGLQLVTLILISLGIYTFISKKNYLSLPFLSSLNLEGLEAGNTVTFYNMDGCPHCKEFRKPGGSWEQFKEKLAQHDERCCEPREVAHTDPEAASNGVSGYPTVLLCDSANKKISECPSRNPDEMLAWVKEECQK